MNKKLIYKNFIKRYAVITCGCLLYSLGVSLFLEAGGLASGGVTGIALIIHQLLTSVGVDFIDTGLLIVIINIPMFILGGVYFGKRFIISTLYSTVVSSLLMMLWSNVFAPYLPLTEDTVNPMLISAVFGGVLFAAGIALIFRMGSSTGGTDIPVKILRKKFRYIKTGIINFVFDLVVVSLSFFVFKSLDVLFYTIISVVIFTPVFNWVLYGGNSATLVFVITKAEVCESMTNRILKELDVGATLIDAKGAYTNNEKRMILCALKPYLYPKLRDIVHEEDKEAFLIVGSSKEIYGEGYKNPDEEDL